MLQPSQRVLATGGPGRRGIGRSAATTRSAIEENAPGPRRAATRVHRVSPDAADPAPAGAPQQIISSAPSESARPVLDLDEVGRDLWNRFEKRMRIEQERRGRG